LSTETLRDDIKATMFGRRELGIAWLDGEDGPATARTLEAGTTLAGTRTGTTNRRAHSDGVVVSDIPTNFATVEVVKTRSLSA
jgi:hypothetical protein